MFDLSRFDQSLFQFINQDAVHPFLDGLMPLVSGNAAFFPLLALLSIVIVRQGGLRGFALVLMLSLSVLVASNWVCAPLKEWIMRPRPAMTLDGVRLLTGNGRGLMAMPSCHATNWGALAVVAWLFHRSSWKFMAPLALLVAYSRVYLGVHYPSDVIVGLLLGLATGACVVGICVWLWSTLGRQVLPAWWARCPSLLKRGAPLPYSEESDELTWRNATWLVMGILFIQRIFYIASDIIELGEDEAYQWMWSQRLDWAYYSKPPMIAWVQWLGTHLWGNTAFGVRFFSPVLALLFGIMLWLFLRKRTSERTAFWSTLIIAATPLFAVGSTLLTVDAPTVFFYTASLLAVWLAIERDSTLWWGLAGLCMALGFLSKFFSPFLWVGLVLFFIWVPEHRRQLYRPGIWLALGLNGLGAVPVVIWNASHGWITATHLQERGGLNHAANFHLASLGEFAGSVAALLNPVFFVAILVAIIGFVRLKNKPVLWRFLFCSSVPVFVFYLALACRAKAQPNWIGPAAPALFLFAVFWWHSSYISGSRSAVRWITAGLAIGLPLVVFLHETRLLDKALKIQLSLKADPLNRVRGGADMARVVGEQRRKLMKEGPPVFLIADHYGRASLLNFYLPEARELLPDRQLAYVLSSDKPQNQYAFWPSYQNRIGENAILVMNGGSNRKPSKRVLKEFSRVDKLGSFKVGHKGKTCGEIQLFVCRNKTATAKKLSPQLTHTR